MFAEWITGRPLPRRRWVRFRRKDLDAVNLHSVGLDAVFGCQRSLSQARPISYCPCSESPGQVWPGGMTVSEGLFSASLACFIFRGLAFRLNISFAAGFAGTPTGAGSVLPLFSAGAAGAGSGSARSFVAIPACPLVTSSGSPGGSSSAGSGCRAAGLLGAIDGTLGSGNEKYRVLFYLGDIGDFI